MSRLVFITCCAVLSAACATEKPTRRAVPLYVSVEVTEHGKTVAAPRMLGFEGRSITTERRAPGAADPDYRLVLKPEESGSGYQVLLDLDLPSGHRQTKVGLLHGEERAVHLDDSTQLKVMLMRVESPEFRALIEARPRVGRGAM